MMNHLAGLDHVVVLVRDLAAAADRWAALGFTISPRGTHSEHMGTGNHTIMLGPDYLELLGVLHPTPHNAPSRALLEEREGVERAAFRATDAAAAVADLKARGIAALGPNDFGRPVDMPDGAKSEARFKTFLWPVDQRPGGMRIFACQHLTPETVWIPELQKHANTARRIAEIDLLADNPEASAAFLAKLVDGTVEREADDVFRLRPGFGKGDIVILGRKAAEARFPASALQGFKGEGALALILEVGNLEAAAKAVGSKGIAEKGRVIVPCAEANGVVVQFVP